MRINLVCICCYATKAKFVYATIILQRTRTKIDASAATLTKKTTRISDIALCQCCVRWLLSKMKT